MAIRGLKMAPRWPKRAPRGAQESPKTAPRALQERPKRGPGGDFRGSRGATLISHPLFFDQSPPRWPQEAPRRPQEAPKMAPRGPKRPPRGPQEAPRWPQEAPKRPPRGLQRSIFVPFFDPTWVSFGKAWGSKQGPKGSPHEQDTTNTNKARGFGLGL